MTHLEHLTNIIEYLVQIVSHRGDSNTHVSGIPMSLIFQLQSDLVLAKGLQEGIEGLILRAKTEMGSNEIRPRMEELHNHIRSVESIKKVIQMAFVIIHEPSLSFRGLSRIRALHDERRNLVCSGGHQQYFLAANIIMPALITDIWLDELENESCQTTYPPVNNKDVVALVMSPVYYHQISDAIFSLNIFLLLSCLMLSDVDFIKTGAHDVLQTFSRTACSAAGLPYYLITAISPLWVLNYSAFRSGEEHIILRGCELPRKVLEACAKLLLIDGELKGSLYIASTVVHASGASTSIFTTYGISLIIGNPDSFLSRWVEFTRMCCMLRLDSSDIRKSITNAICNWAVETGRLALILQSSIGDLVTYINNLCSLSYVSGGRTYSRVFTNQSFEGSCRCFSI